MAMWLRPLLRISRIAGISAGLKTQIVFPLLPGELTARSLFGPLAPVGEGGWVRGKGGFSMPLFFIMLAWLSLGLLVSSAAADSAAVRGLALVNACAACHGPDGRSHGAIPSIDHLSVEEFTAALKAFRAEARQGTVMNRIAKGVDDAEISAMARYFAARQGR
jgi:cytochrome c553